jgi:hypothetical protein
MEAYEAEKAKSRKRAAQDLEDARAGSTNKRYKAYQSIWKV